MNYPTTKSKIYGVWANMKERCDNPNYKSYKDYGGRGIGYCPNWKDFKKFCDDMLMTYKSGLTLDRTDNEAGYSPENCRWISNKEQQSNKRNSHLVTHQGVTQSIAEWAEKLEMKYNTLWTRLTVYGWPIEKAMTNTLTQGRRP